MSGGLFGYARVSVVREADVNNWRTSAGFWPGLRGRGQRGLLEPAGAESPEGRPPAGRLRESGGAGPLGPIADRGFGAAGMAAREGHRNRQPPGVRRPGQRHGTGDAASSHRLRGDGARPGRGEDAGGAGADKGYWQAPRAAQGRQPEAGRGDTEHAPARRPLVGPHRHDNRIALQQHPPDLHLGSRRDSADGLWRRITGLPGPGRCLHEERHRLWNQTTRKTMFSYFACDPDHELGDGYTPAFCGDHSPEPASSEPRRPRLAVLEFVREHMRRRDRRKAGVQDRLLDLPQQAER